MGNKYYTECNDCKNWVQIAGDNGQGRCANYFTGKTENTKRPSSVCNGYINNGNYGHDSGQSGDCEIMHFRPFPRFKPGLRAELDPLAKQG